MPVIQDVIRLLLALAAPAALVALVLAGLALRREGTLSFGPGTGGFSKWMFWAAILLTVPSLLNWFSLWGIRVPVATGSPNTRFLFNLQIDVMTFVNLWVIGRLVPVIAAFFVLRAVLDTSAGGTPLASILAAMFLLAAPATLGLMMRWGGGVSNNYATVDMLADAWTYLTTRIMPVASGLAVCGAIFSFASGRPALRQVGCAAAFLIIPAIHRLVLRMM